MRSGSRLLPGKDSEAGNRLELNWEDPWDLGLEPYWPGAPAFSVPQSYLKRFWVVGQGRDGAVLASTAEEQHHQPFLLTGKEKPGGSGVKSRPGQQPWKPIPQAAESCFYQYLVSNAVA